MRADETTTPERENTHTNPCNQVQRVLSTRRHKHWVSSVHPTRCGSCGLAGQRLCTAFQSSALQKVGIRPSNASWVSASCAHSTATLGIRYLSSLAGQVKGASEYSVLPWEAIAVRRWPTAAWRVANRQHDQLETQHAISQGGHFTRQPRFDIHAPRRVLPGRNSGGSRSPSYKGAERWRDELASAQINL